MIRVRSREDHPEPIGELTAMIADGTINRRAMIWQLHETQDAIDSLISEIESGEHDDAESVVIGIPFAHIVGHLCLAWHRKWMSNEDLDKLTQEQFQLMMRSIPQWYVDTQMVEIDEPKGFDRRVADGKHK